MQQSGGAVAVHSEPGSGSRFEIFLPRVDAPLTRDPPPPAPASRVGSGTVLLVEDEEMVREVARRALESDGYRVWTAEDGKAALARVEGRLDEIDLVVTDVVMNGMGGPELARHLRASRPALPVLFMSGYVEKRGKEAQEVGLESSFLSKPFTVRALLDRVGALLAHES